MIRLRGMRGLVVSSLRFPPISRQRYVNREEPVRGRSPGSSAEVSLIYALLAGHCSAVSAAMNSLDHSVCDVRDPAAVEKGFTSKRHRFSGQAVPRGVIGAALGQVSVHAGLETFLESEASRTAQQFPGFPLALSFPD
jgi:hypothetical protein